MKTDRLIGIIVALQKNKRMTAPQLAEMFEVSRRTINRDIDDICKAGIPLVTAQGRNGGISIMDGYTVDTAVFTENEREDIFAGLHALDSVSVTPASKSLAVKFTGSGKPLLSDVVVIDLASFYKYDISHKIEKLKTAVKSRRAIRFTYCSKRGESEKYAEPYLIVYKWSSWYVFAYSPEREDFRMYKLGRMSDLTITDDVFSRREVPSEKYDFDSFITDDYFVTAVFDPSVKYRLIEQYGEKCYTVMDSGLYTRLGFTDPDAAVQWYLSFGDKVTVISPPEFVEIFKNTLDSINKKYF